MNKHSALYRVDRRVAYASAWREFFDLLHKIFCNDTRTLSYYAKHDLEDMQQIKQTKFIKGQEVFRLGKREPSFAFIDLLKMRFQ